MTIQPTSVPLALSEYSILRQNYQKVNFYDDILRYYTIFLIIKGNDKVLIIYIRNVKCQKHEACLFKKKYAIKVHSKIF